MWFHGDSVVCGDLHLRDIGLVHTLIHALGIVHLGVRLGSYGFGICSKQLRLKNYYLMNNTSEIYYIGLFIKTALKYSGTDRTTRRDTYTRRIY